ncbi:hypothetical protein FRC00_011451, partial [Tulasnella sp. 408]
MASIDKLPPETLSHIFSLLFQSVKEDRIPPVDSQAYELLDILLVCRRWNKVACQTPSLWTIAHVGTDQDAWPRVWRCIERSGGLPLDVNFMPLRDDEGVDRASMALKALLPQASRWRSLSLPYMMDEISEQLSSLPNLVELTLHPITEEDGNFSSDLSLCIDAPNLETLLIKSYEVYFHDDKWPHLKSLESRDFLGSEAWLWGLLGSSQDTLEKLVLRQHEGLLDMNNQGLEDEFGEQMKCNRLAVLKALEISATGMLKWSGLRFAEMPALRHLTINQECFEETENLEYSVPPFPSLESLHISTDHAPDMERVIEFLLPLTPNITSLTLIDGSGVDQGTEGHLLLPLLLHGDSGPLLCQRLEDLELGGTPTPIDKLKRFVELREPGIKRISCHELWCPSAGSLEEKMLEEARQGLEWLEKRVEL